MGVIASIANVVFLGGSERFAVSESFFHFHNFDWNFPGAHTMTPDNFAYNTQQVDSFKTYYRALFKAHTKLTDAYLEALQFLEHPKVMDPATAQSKDVIQQIGLPGALPGTFILNVDY
jgi:ATP-dependent protease ClpP protease subunit